MNSKMIVEKIKFYGWRTAVVVAMLTWTYYRYELIGDTIKGLIHIGLDLIVIGFIARKLYTSKFRWASPRKYFSSAWSGENKLASITLWILPWTFVFAVAAGCIYKFGFDMDVALIIIGFVFFIMLLQGIVGFFDSCLVDKDKEKDE